MATFETALQIALDAHAGQVDMDGAAYITHPLRIVNAVEGNDARIVAILHDVVEDSTTTLDDLRSAGFSEDILSAVECLTRRRGMLYADYVVRCKGHRLARQVKLADLEDNGRLDRCIVRVEQVVRDLARIHRYTLSYKFLMDQLTEAEYRSLMAKYGEP